MPTQEQRKIDNMLFYARETFNVKLFRRFKKALEQRGYDIKTVRDACYMAAQDGVFTL